MPTVEERRLETIRGLADAGIPVGVMTASMIFNDHELEAILDAAKAAGANRRVSCCACRSRSRIYSPNGSRPKYRSGPCTC